MRRSNLFLTSSKESETGLDCRSAELAVKAGLVKNFGSGTWSYSHLGRRVLDNIEKIIRDEMDEISQEVMMNQLQTSTIWKESGRWKNFEGEEFFSFENRDGKDFTIAATHEEAATELAKDYIRSYRDLDLAVYQIGRKFRDDHARKGLLRAKEFIMKDAYSFHRDRKGLHSKYSEFIEAYREVFDTLGLEYSEVSAENGSMGGSRSHEFIAEAEVGNDTYLKCKGEDCIYGTKDLEKENCGDCGAEMEKVNGIEIGHCFMLDDRYSDSMDLTFTGEDGEERNVLMASYGNGVSRLISAIIEQNNDEKGVEEKAEEIYSELEEENDIILYEDEQSVGEQFAEADLIGVKNKIILGNNYLENRKIEVEKRKGETIELENLDELREVISS